MQVNPWTVALPVASGMAAGISAWGAVQSTSQIFGPTLCRTPSRTQIALTFDDGPNPAVTPRLLALLEQQNVRATFFVVGQFARACRELVRETAARGHVIGNHTETHANLALASATRIEDELTRCQSSIASALGLDTPGSQTPSSHKPGPYATTPGAAGLPRWTRPPFGYRRPQVWSAARRAGLRGIAMWSFTAYDWKPQQPERLVKRLARVAERQASGSRGEIVLLHDGDFRALGADRSHVLAALAYWLPRWQDAGFEFVTIDQVAGAMVAGT